MRPKNFHEGYVEGEIKPASERSTGLVFAGVGAIIAARWYDNPKVLWIALPITLGLVIVSFLQPVLLRPLTIFWFHFGRLIHRIINPIMMLIMFVLVFIPAGMIMRIWRDPLRSRRMPKASSYWIERGQSAGGAESMTNQF
jgi:hypothetical protein